MKKLPDNAKIMFEGVRYNVWQWEQTLFDGSTAVFEAASRADCVTLIATVGDKILVLQEEQPGQPPFLALPGGHCEGLDSPERTARFKLEEEAGYKADNFIKWFVAPYGWVIGDNYFFIAKNVVEIGGTRTDPGDKITPKLISFDEFLDFRKTSEIRNKELLPVLERAANNPDEKQKLYDLIFGDIPEAPSAESTSVADVAEVVTQVLVAPVEELASVSIPEPVIDVVPEVPAHMVVETPVAQAVPVAPVAPAPFTLHSPDATDTSEVTPTTKPPFKLV